MRTAFLSLEQNSESTCALKQLYKDILSSFIDKIYRDNKYRCNRIHQDTIYQLEKSIKNLLQDPQKLFLAADKYKEGSAYLDSIELNFLQSKQENININNNQTFKKSTEELIKIEHVSSNLLKEEDILEFRFQPQQIDNIQPIPLKRIKEYQQNYDIKQFVKVENFSSSQQNSQDSRDEEQLKIDFSKFLNCRLVGIYSTSRTKYKVKEQKYEIALVDTFLKFPEGQLFIDNLLIQISYLDQYLLKRML